jgi:4-methyl-5(b-hydroxyethyl)-thiazole monophosphate biosynthesis
MPKKAIVILAEGFEEIEAVTAVDILRRAGINVTVAGVSDIKVTGARGLAMIADKKLEATDMDFDACVLPGGMPGAANLASSEKVRTIITKMNREGKIVAAICASPAVVLAPLGILKNKSATCYPGMQENIGKETNYKKNNVVVDGNIITSRGPATALEFSLTIAEKLSGKEISDRVKIAVLLD